MKEAVDRVTSGGSLPELNRYKRSVAPRAAIKPGFPSYRVVGRKENPASTARVSCPRTYKPATGSRHLTPSGVQRSPCQDGPAKLGPTQNRAEEADRPIGPINVSGERACFR